MNPILARRLHSRRGSPPEAPTGLAATPGDTISDLTWNAVTGATSYSVRRSLVAGGPYTEVGTPATNSFQDTGLMNNVTYYYVVAAVNAFGTSANSGEVSSLFWMPDDTDPDIWGWWRADSYIDLVGSTQEINAWGDYRVATVDKTDTTDTRNLSAFTALTPRPIYSESNTQGNMLTRSEDINTAQWATTNFTKNSSTTGTFTAMNGVLFQNCQSRAGITYRLRAKLRAVTGNTALNWFHQGSATGTTTAVNITGTLTEYTVTFLGSATSANIQVGISDPNAGGFGQIECTEWHLIESGWDTTYLANSTILVKFPSVGSGNHRLVWTFENPDGMLRHNMSVNDNLAQPSTMYFLIWPRTKTGNGLYVASINPVWAFYMDLNTARPSIYVNVAPFSRVDSTKDITLNTFNIITCVFNGASSSIRVNKQTADTGTVGSQTANRGFYIGGDGFGGGNQNVGFKEVIFRSVADNTATQDQYIDYLAARVGLAV